MLKPFSSTHLRQLLGQGDGFAWMGVLLLYSEQPQTAKECGSVGN